MGTAQRKRANNGFLFFAQHKVSCTMKLRRSKCFLMENEKSFTLSKEMHFRGVRTRKAISNTTFPAILLFCNQKFELNFKASLNLTQLLSSEHISEACFSILRQCIQCVYLSGIVLLGHYCTVAKNRDKPLESNLEILHLQGPLKRPRDNE